MNGLPTVSIEEWLKQHGLGQFAEMFASNGIDFDVLPDLTDAELEQLGLPIGHRKRLMRALGTLGARSADRPPGPAVPTSQPAEQTAEPMRRHLTAMFCDVIGSTALSAAMDPEDYRVLMGRVQNAAKAAILSQGGSIGQYQGDGILAYFGYPVAHEDNAARAARAGLELAARVAGTALSSGERLAIRIGIATGLVVIGCGEGEDQNQAFGDALNLAARIQTLAPENGVLVADATRQLLGHSFELDDFGKHALKGIPNEVRVWRVRSERLIELRFDAAHGSQLTPLVDREEERAKLLSLWALAKRGHGQVAMLSGEAGIGKSRVSSALLREFAGEAHLVMRYQCSPNHVDSPFYPVVAHLTFAAGLSDQDPPDIKLNKLETLLRAGNISEQDLHLLAQLVSIPMGPQARLEEMTPMRRKERTIAALLTHLRELSDTLPVLVFIEDLHWADASTLDLLNRVVHEIRRMNVLVLATFRADFAPAWIGFDHTTMIRLNRLSPAHTADMLAELTLGKSLPREIYDQIQSRTDGVPLFVEELTKAVLESGLLKEEDDHFSALAPLQSLAIPGTLRDSLTARLDRLATVRDIAQIGSVLGREFSYHLLAVVSGMPAERLQTGLAQLIAAELIFARGQPPHAVYSFKHALVQDVAYESMLRSRCSALHARAAEAIIEVFPETAETQPELVAMHLGRSGQVERAIEYLLRAGRRAIERSANTEAIGQLRHAIDLLQSLPESPERAARALRLEVALGQAMIASYGYAHPGTREVLWRASTHISSGTDDDQKFAILYQLWASYYVSGDVKMQREASSNYLRLASELGDDGMLCVAHRIVGTTLMNMGQFAFARVHLEKARDLYDPAKHAALRFQFGQDIGATASCYLAWTLWHLGHPVQSRCCARMAVAIARELKHPHTLAYTLCHVEGMLDIFRHDDSATRVHARSVIALADEHGFPFWAAGGRVIDGWAAARQGKADEGLQLLREGIAAWRTTGSKVWLPFFLALEAQAHSEAERITAARQTIEEALALAAETGETWAVPEMLRISAAIMLRMGETRTARARLEEALISARGQEARWWELLIATDLAALLHKGGNAGGAEARLAPALDPWQGLAGERAVQRAERLLTKIRGALR